MNDANEKVNLFELLSDIELLQSEIQNKLEEEKK